MQRLWTVVLVKNNPNKADDHFAEDIKANAPKIILIHAQEDQTVPFSSSKEFFESLQELEVPGRNYLILIVNSFRSGVSLSSRGFTCWNGIWAYGLQRRQ